MQQDSITSRYCDDNMDISPMLTAPKDTQSSAPEAIVTMDNARQPARPLKRRWYILTVYSLMTFTQACIWNTFGPISQTAFKVFPEWDNSTIAMFSNWGCITFVVFLLPMTWITQQKGLRWSLLLSTLFVFCGTGLRCITIDGRLYTPFIHIAQFLNGISGIIACTAPLLISAAWFPPNERTTSTAISTGMNLLGAASPFIIGPYIMQDEDTYTNSTDIKYLSELEDNILKFMYIEFSVAVIILVCVILYFPSKPHVPPSISASVPRYNIKESIIIIIKDRNLLLITGAYSLALVVFDTWTSVMNLTLESIGMSQTKSGWLGFIMVVSGCGVSLITGRFSDVFRKRMKCTLVCGLLLYAGLNVVFAFIIVRLLSVTEEWIYVILISMGSSNLSLAPIMGELSCEMAYPIDENVVGALLTGSGNVVGMLFLFIFFIPNVGISWVNWCLLASAIIPVPLILLINENYRRSDVDENT